jgi:phosphatidylinositol alpha-1,6-mannosyltransferase
MITPGVDFDCFYPAPAPTWLKDKYQIGNGPVLLTVGRLVKKKGHDTILNSLPQVVKEFPSLRYLIVGDGPERSRLEQLTTSLGLSETAVFVGNVPHAQLGDYYRAADIFCMINQMDETGDVETFGMVFLEANATGKPVIGGRSGGTTQSILDGETGFLSEPEQPAQAAKWLLLLLRDADLRERMGNIGFQRARQDFDWTSRAAQLFEIHNRMVHSSPLCYRKVSFS